MRINIQSSESLLLEIIRIDEVTDIGIANGFYMPPIVHGYFIHKIQLMTIPGEVQPKGMVFYQFESFIKSPNGNQGFMIQEQ